MKKKVRKSPNKKRGRKRKIEKIEKMLNIRIINDTNIKKKDKREKECIDCKGVGDDECTMCGESEHMCKGMIIGQDEIWVCKECTENMRDECHRRNKRSIKKRKRKKTKRRRFGDERENLLLLCDMQCENNWKSIMC